MKKGIAYLLMVLFACALTGCEKLPNMNANGGDPPRIGQPQEVSEGILAESGIGLYPGYVELAKGSAIKLYAYAMPDDPNADFTWETSDAGIAEVAQDGSVTAKAQGEAVIIASLRQSPAVKAACTVSVKEEGPAYLYNGPPSDPPDDPPDGPGEPGDEPGEGEEPPQGDSDGQGDPQNEGDIPIEYDDSIPVEVIPSIDEFVWTIKIDDVFDWQSTQGDFVQHVLNRLQLTGIKNGGKTPFGEYRCAAAMDVDYPEGDIDAYLSSSDSIAKTQFSPLYTFDAFVFVVEPMDAGALYPGASDPAFQRLMRANYTAMAAGEIAMNLSGSGTATLTDKEGTSTGSEGQSLSAMFPYKLRISKSGVVVLTYETKATQNNVYTFRGQLYRRPIIPK